MDSNNKYLKFLKLSDYEIVVDYERNRVRYSQNVEDVMSYNFQQMEFFCHRLGKKDLGTVESSTYRYYIVLKNFSHEKIHVPGQEVELYTIYQDREHNLSDIFTIYANGKYYIDEGFVAIDIQNPFLKSASLLKKYEKTVCTISIIDYEGNDRFTHYEVFLQEEFTRSTKSFSRFIRRNIILRNPLELLHNGDMAFSLNIDFFESGNTATEDLLDYSFEENSPGQQDLLLDSIILKTLCENSCFFQAMLNSHWLETETRRLSLPLEIIEDLKNIYRFYMGYLKITSYKNIYSLYKTAHVYDFDPVVEFCRRLFEKHICLSNFKLIRNLSWVYDDVELRLILIEFHDNNTIPKQYTCDLDIDDLDIEESGHIHNAFGEYLQWNISENLHQQTRELYSGNEEEDIELSFFPIFQNGREMIMLSLESEFGKTFCEKSAVMKEMLEYLETESKEIEIRHSHFEPLKNIYRILMGVDYIKANKMADIISLYEVADFYDIPQVMELCRYFFQWHMCTRNVEAITELAKKCIGDVELDRIVKTFQLKVEEYDNQTKRNVLHWQSDIEMNSVLLRSSNVRYDFYR